MEETVTSDHGIDYRRDGDVVTVTLNRPDRLNAVNLAAEQALDECWRRVEADDGIRCVVLTGAGRAFCAGADMKDSDGPDGLHYWAGTGDNGFGGIANRANFPVPLIARVNGLALGGGFEMVLAADIIVAADTATFGLPEATVGRLPLDGMISLPRLIPEKRALGMMMTGARMTAEEAYRWGLANEIATAEQLDNAVAAWVERIISAAPLSVRAIKQSWAKTRHLPAAEARNMRLPALARALTSDDANEGVLAFQEKRKPLWRGR